MAHFNVRTRQSKSGLKWLVTEAQWQPGQEKVREKVLTPTVLADLGFSSNMTPAQAKEHAKKLNALNEIKRKEQKSKVRASERLHDLTLIGDSIVPVEMSEMFILHIEENWQGGPYNLRKQAQHWKLIQKMITALKIQPHEYLKRKNEFYRYFEQHRMGKSYVEKVLKVLNKWGDFYAEQTKTYFKKVPAPQGITLQRIKKAALRATGEGATALTPELLKHMNGRLDVRKWSYLHASLWFGFRPSELDAIIEDRDAHLKVEEQDGVTVVGIYQGKLVSIDEHLRWRWVPCIHAEQSAALDRILNGHLQKTTVKTMRKAAPSDAGEIGLYSGRKGFTDLMLSLGQSLEDVTQWLGHTSIERTWKHYKNKKKVHFKIIAK
jgi:hypothetical protein